MVICVLCIVFCLELKRLVKEAGKDIPYNGPFFCTSRNPGDGLVVLVSRWVRFKSVSANRIALEKEVRSAIDARLHIDHRYGLTQIDFDEILREAWGASRFRTKEEYEDVVDIYRHFNGSRAKFPPYVYRDSLSPEELFYDTYKSSREVSGQ